MVKLLTVKRSFNILNFLNCTVNDLNIYCSPEEEHVKLPHNHLCPLVLIIRLKLMIELTLCKWQLYLEHVLARTVNRYLLGAWITHWTIFWQSLFKCFHTRRTGLLLEKSSPMVFVVSQHRALQEKAFFALIMWKLSMQDNLMRDFNYGIHFYCYSQI